MLMLKIFPMQPNMRFATTFGVCVDDVKLFIMGLLGKGVELAGGWSVIIRATLSSLLKSINFLCRMFRGDRVNTSCPGEGEKYIKQNR